MKKKFIKFTLVIPALAGLFLLASLPNFSTKANGKNFWYETEDEITIDKTVHDFGTVIVSSDSLSATFTLTNNTKVPFVITDVLPSCGCTTPYWTKEPIGAGKTGSVIAKFGTKNYRGPFDKPITILTSGNPDRFFIRIKGIVE